MRGDHRAEHEPISPTRSERPPAAGDDVAGLVSLPPTGSPPAVLERISRAPPADASDGRQALLIAVETTIVGGRVVVRAPRRGLGVGAGPAHDQQKRQATNELVHGEFPFCLVANLPMRWACSYASRGSCARARAWLCSCFVRRDPL